MNDEQIFAAIARGCCTEKAAAEKGCAMCGPMYEAVAIIRGRFAELETTKSDLEEARLGCDVLATGDPYERLGSTLDALARLRKAAREYVEVAEVHGVETIRDVARDALEAELGAGHSAAPDAYRAALLRLVRADEATFGTLRNPADAMDDYDQAIAAARTLLGVGDHPLTDEALEAIAAIGAGARAEGDHEGADYADAVLFLHSFDDKTSP